MLERFTERARQVVVLAEEESRALGHNYIGTEHLLLGLLRDDGGLATRALAKLDITLEEARARLVRIADPAGELVTGQWMPFTPGAEEVLDLASQESMRLAHTFIGTEHILLALARHDDDATTRFLSELGAPVDKVADALGRRLSTKIIGGSLEFTTVSAEVLAARGIALDAPRSSPPMSEADAVAIASRTARQVAVLESRYAHCRIVSKNPPVDRDCWVFSLDPTGLASTRGVPADYFLVVVDPASGEVLLSGWGAPGRDSSPLPPDPRLSSVGVRAGAGMRLPMPVARPADRSLHE